MKINQFTSKEEATASAGESLHNLLMANTKKPVLLLLSAGSALNLLDYVSKQGTGENLSIAMLDERFSNDPKINNFAQFQKTDFYTFALEMETNFFGSLPRKEETKEMLAERLEKNVRNWKTQNPEGLIIATLGMGADGHTAGIFPNANENEFNELFNRDSWFVAYFTDKHEYKDRVTSTIPLLKQVDKAIGFVCGQDKKEKFEKLTKKQGKIYQFPAFVWHDFQDIQIFTDIN